MRQVKIYDTTLRDGTQAEYFNLSLADKIRIAKKLAQFGVHYIEGGWPGANPKDSEFFNEIRQYGDINGSHIAAFGSTHHKDRPPTTDPVFQELLISRAQVITIFGKSSLFQVKEILQTTPERNLELIQDSLAYLKPEVRELFYDAEHFFDGFKDNKEYALKTLGRAFDGGADVLVLCDTNGGTLTSELVEIIKAVQAHFSNYPEPVPLGIHAHNDSELAVANSLAAVELGCVQVQGTINGFGERCGNANLCSIIPALKLKMGIDCLSDEKLKKLTEISRYVYELANVAPNRYQPYVGVSAFAHKGGIHAAAVKRNPKAYEHLKPELVGNVRHIPVSDLSGKSSIFLKAKELGLEPAAHDQAVQFALAKIQELDLKIPPKSTESLQTILEKVKDLEADGYQFETADASLELLLRAALGQYKEYFRLLSYRVVDQKAGEDDTPAPEATIRVRVGRHEVHTAALGNGPVDALFKALLKALIRFYPRLAEMRLEDYKVRVLPGTGSTDAKVRVLIESRDAHDRWGTVGVSCDIIEASWAALVDGINYKLFKDERPAR
jgi:2-isopropylmalate synthase